FLQDGIVGISHLMEEPLIEEPPARAPRANGTTTAGASNAPTEPDIVPIDSLLYRGPAALARARLLRDTLRADGSSAESLAELFDLLDLAGSS
ncbi:MAG TPA: hypothetical protein VNW46_06155, partial [Gemmatimonadaceae bacterium]|nr:hypothetical protein [Gemmatimonadaceae bacterium]